MIKRILIAVFFSGAVLISYSEILFAHSFSERYKSPIDISFVLLFLCLLIGLCFLVNQNSFSTNQKLAEYPKFNILKIVILRKFLTNNYILFLMKLISVLLLILIISTSFMGSQNPAANFAPTFVWVIFWTGFGLFCAFIGNIWNLLNPWKTTFEWAEIVIGRKISQRDISIWEYPQILDVWPAVSLILVLAWLENVFVGATNPLFLGFIISIYSIVTWAGMLAFGKTVWLKKFDPISVTFEVLSTFSIFEFRGRNKSDNSPTAKNQKENEAMFLRPLSTGLINLKKPSYAKMVFIIALSSTVIYSAILEVPLWLSIKAYWIGVIQDLTGISIYSPIPGYLIDFLGMLLFWRMCFAFYSGVIHLLKILLKSQVSALELKLHLIWILLPLTIFIKFAHEFAFFLVDAQMIIPLISDPFGFGWNLFGTVDFGRNLLHFDAKIAFLVLLISIITGGVYSVIISNVLIKQITDSDRPIILSKLPLFVFFLVFMTISVLLVSQPMLL